MHCATPREPRVVQLLGEVGDWNNPISLSWGDGFYAATVRLPVGVFSYKLRIGGRQGEWVLDTANKRSRNGSGTVNSLLSIGGAPEPVIFAPNMPFLYTDRSGACVVTAALRKEASIDALTVMWREEANETRIAMTRIHEEVEHWIFRARIETSASRATIAFELTGGARIECEETGEPFAYDAHAGDTPPEWWSNAIVYTIFIDRFRPLIDHSEWERDPGANLPSGGHLHGITRSLDSLAELGINTLYLTPMHPGATCHRYDMTDPLQIDPALGGEEAFRELVGAAHERSMRVIVDFSFAHVGCDFEPYKSVQKYGKESQFAPWFRWTDEGALIHYGRRTDAPLLDLDHPGVRALVFETAEVWARRGVDGFRLDAAAEVPIDLARDVRTRLLSICPDAVVVGEVVPAHAWKWRACGAVDAATDFGFFQAMTDFIAHGIIDGAEVARRLQILEYERGAAIDASLRFISTHDHVRFASWARATGRGSKLPLGIFALLTSPGVPAILYGEELALFSSTISPEPEAVWPDRMPMPWSSACAASNMRDLVRGLIAARKASQALMRGEIESIFGEGEILAFRRRADEDVVDVVINIGDADAAIDLVDDDRPALEIIAQIGAVIVESKTQTITLRGSSAVAVRRCRVQ